METVIDSVESIIVNIELLMKGMLLTLTETIPNSVPVAIPTYLHEIGSKTEMQSEVAAYMLYICQRSCTHETHVAPLS